MDPAIERQWHEQMGQLQQLGHSMASRAFDFGSVQIEARAWEEAAEQARTSDLLRRNEEEERPCWPELYESRHDAAPPEVFRGPFEAAHQAAREEKRLLLVWTLGAFRDRLHGTIWNQYVFII